MASVSGTRRGWLTRVRAWWRSPEDQPGWARPALLGLTVVAGFLYAWNAAGNLEIYYAAAVRSMSMSWHDFVFAAFDPAGTITVDKLPGAFWVQALSVRVFGVHAWAIVAPQVLEGMASVLVLYRVVRRLAGPVAGIVAAGGARAVAGDRRAQPREHPGHADGPAAAAGGRRDGQRDLRGGCGA